VLGIVLAIFHSSIVDRFLYVVKKVASQSMLCRESGSRKALLEGGVFMEGGIRPPLASSIGFAFTQVLFTGFNTCISAAAR
jgi:hypothetical protein